MGYDVKAEDTLTPEEKHVVYKFTNAMLQFCDTDSRYKEYKLAIESITENAFQRYLRRKINTQTSIIDNIRLFIIEAVTQDELARWIYDYGEKLYDRGVTDGKKEQWSKTLDLMKSLYD